MRGNLLDGIALRRHTARIPWEQFTRGSAMRRLTLAAGAACAMLMFDSASAQNGTNSGTTMPGQVVGSYTGTVKPVGQKQPAAAPQVGTPITSNPMMRP